MDVGRTSVRHLQRHLGVRNASRLIARNSTLISDKFFEIAQHELGHHIVARELGFEVGNVEMTLTGQTTSYGPSHVGGAIVYLQRRICSLKGLDLYLRQRIQVLYAGATAQSLRAGKLRADLDRRAQTENAADDVAKARELIELILNLGEGVSGVLSPAARLNATNQAIQDLWQATSKIVEAQTKVIERAGLELATRAVCVQPGTASMSPDEIAALAPLA